MEYKVGDMVIVKKAYLRNEGDNPIAKIVGIHSMNNYPCEFVQYIGGHSCGTLAKAGHGWNVSDNGILCHADLTIRGAIK